MEDYSLNGIEEHQQDIAYEDEDEDFDRDFDYGYISEDFDYGYIGEDFDHDFDRDFDYGYLDEDFDIDFDYGYIDEEENYEEEEEVEELIPVEMTSPSPSPSPRVSSSIADGSTLQGAVVINNGLLDDSNEYEGIPRNQQDGGVDGGKKELNRGEIDVCPICFEAWTSGGLHQICCLPCGHIYGKSCIKKWLQRCPSSGKCPQCNSLCTLKDVRVLYATRLCIAGTDLHEHVCSRLDALELQSNLLKQRMDCLEQRYNEHLRLSQQNIDH